VQFVGWQPGKTSTELKTQICEALTDAKGWDVLFFAGHSNETAITGGELAIARSFSGKERCRVLRYALTVLLVLIVVRRYSGVRLSLERFAAPCILGRRCSQVRSTIGH
jgi:hypothetical protein